MKGLADTTVSRWRRFSVAGDSASAEGQRVSVAGKNASAEGQRVSVPGGIAACLAMIRRRMPQAALSVLFFLVVFAFFLWLYPHHLHYHEQYQVFLYTGRYVSEVLEAPGGVAELISRFLVQFFAISWVGALIMAVLLTWLQLATWGAMGTRRQWLYPLSFVPAILMWMALCDENVMPTAPIALALALTTGCLVAKISNAPIRAILAICLSPVMYVALGPLAIVLPFAASLPPTYLAIAVLLVLLSPLWAQYAYPYPAGRLYCGLHYHRFPLVIPWIVWLAALAAAVIPNAPKLKMKQN